jgi:hypothetical protein
MRLRAVTPADASLLEDLMLLAGFPPDRPLPPDARHAPHVRAFVDGWGRPGDVGVIAERCTSPTGTVPVEELRSIGAAWARVLPDLAPLPELAICGRS